MTDRSSPPPVGTPEPVRLPAVQRETLPNGLDVLVCPRRDLPVVELHLVVRAGAMADAPGGEGMAALVAELVDEGSERRTGVELADELERLGARLAIETGWDATTLALHVLRPRLEHALELFAEIASAPAFPDAEVRRKRQETIASLVREDDEPAALANKAFTAAVYGPAHRYGLPLRGTRERVAVLDRDSLVRFHADGYRPADAFLVAAGDVDGSAVAALRRSLGGWTGATAAATASPPQPPDERRAIHIVDRPGASQSEIRVGHAGPPRSSPDYFPLLVLNTMLGGSFTSRLNQKLREEKGFTYGARSQFALRRDGGPFHASVAVYTADTAEAVADTLNEIRRLRDDGFPAAELERAKQYLALGLARRFQTVGAVAAMLADAELHGLGAEFYDAWADRIAGVTARDVQRAAAVHLRPARATIAIVGDRARITADLERLELGDIIDIDNAGAADRPTGEQDG